MLFNHYLCIILLLKFLLGIKIYKINQKNLEKQKLLKIEVISI